MTADWEIYQNITSFFHTCACWIEHRGFWGTLVVVCIMLGVGEKLEIVGLGFCILAFYLFSLPWAIAFVILYILVSLGSESLARRRMQCIIACTQKIVDALERKKESREDHFYDD